MERRATQTRIGAQHTALSPMLQHAVRLLQLSSADFANHASAALATNPFLEGDDAQVVCPDPRVWCTAASQYTGESVAPDPFDSIAAPVSLQAHLLQQLNAMALSPRARFLASAIAQMLDDDGYLRHDLSSLCDFEDQAPAPDAAEMEIALGHVQSLEPAGVGGRSVAECLTLQLPAIRCGATRKLAKEILEEHINLLAAKDIVKLAHRTGALQTEVQIACDEIRRLDAKPGLRYGIQLTHYVVPDVIAVKRERKNGTSWGVELNEAIVPKIRLNAVYANLLYQSRPKDGSLASLNDQLQAARWTVRNQAQRFTTIRDVANVIVEKQTLFFDYGPLGLKPLALKDVAIELGIHESTVSRATNNKFISTPHGTFSLKYFFSRGMSTSDGKECSPEAVKKLVEQCIESEDAKEPLSDAAIARWIQSQGVSVARRTVTKYRQSLRIEPVARRCASLS